MTKKCKAVAASFVLFQIDLDVGPCMQPKMFENAFLMYRATYSIVLNNRLVVLIVLHGIYQCKSSLPKLPGFQTATAEKTEKIAGLLLRPEEYI